MACRHPPPSTLPFLFCRSCGFWENGVRTGEPTNANLAKLLAMAKADDAPVQLHNNDDPN